jgi:hypothetical protein
MDGDATEHTDPSDATDGGSAGEEADLLDRIDVELAKVEESLALLDDQDVDPDDAVAWLDQPTAT